MLQRPIRALLIPDRRRLDGPDRLAARTAGPVPRPDLQIVGELLEARQRVKHLARQLFGGAAHVRRFFQQVRAADVTDKHEVPGKNANRFIRWRAAVRQEQRNMLRRMSWRVEHLEGQLADLECIPVFEQAVAVPGGVCVVPLRPSFV